MRKPCTHKRSLAVRLDLETTAMLESLVTKQSTTKTAIVEKAIKLLYEKEGGAK